MKTIEFGTDGIRGKANLELTPNIAYSVGNALSRLQAQKARIAIGRDTRLSSDMLFSSLAAGAMSAGIDVCDLGVTTTSCVAFSTTHNNLDFGVMISASHNPKEYNGIKVFNHLGFKLDESVEEKVENLLLGEYLIDNNNIGHFFEIDEQEYTNTIIDSINVDLSKLKVVFDCANGAGSKTIEELTKRLPLQGKIFFNNSLGNINENCGATEPGVISKLTVSNNADIGVALDGDADRVILIDEKGNVVDGDTILYILTSFAKNNGLLKNNKVVGTLHTNLGIEKELNNIGVTLIRANIGDKFVAKAMQKLDINYGAEQSGHVILKKYFTTGDGILTALKIMEIMQKTSQKLSELANLNKYPQSNLNVIVTDKKSIMANEDLNAFLVIKEEELKNSGRLLVRASGTEPKIRVMVEAESNKIANQVACEIADYINKIANLS